MAMKITAEVCNYDGEQINVHGPLEGYMSVADFWVTMQCHDNDPVKLYIQPSYGEDAEITGVGGVDAMDDSDIIDECWHDDIMEACQIALDAQRKGEHKVGMVVTDPYRRTNRDE